MRSIEMPLYNREGFMQMLEVDDFEYVDPVSKMAEIYLTSSVFRKLNYRKLDKRLAEVCSEEETIEMGKAEGFEDFKDHFARVRRMPVPEELIKLFPLNKKKRQQDEIRMLSSRTILTSNQLMAFIYCAYEEHGYTYSMYTGEKLPRGVNPDDMPKMAYKEKDDDVTIWGNTPLTKGKVKSVITDRSVTIGKFLDKGDKWHCFFYTMDGICGKEKGQGPHIHYVSNAWGHSRQKVVQDIKSGEYSLNADNHIPYERYS